MIQHSYQEKCPYCNPGVVDKAHERALANQIERDHDAAWAVEHQKNQAEMQAKMTELSRQGIRGITSVPFGQRQLGQSVGAYMDSGFPMIQTACFVGTNVCRSYR